MPTLPHLRSAIIHIMQSAKLYLIRNLCSLSCPQNAYFATYKDTAIHGVMDQPQDYLLRVTCSIDLTNIQAICSTPEMTSYYYYIASEYKPPIQRETSSALQLMEE